MRLLIMGPQGVGKGTQAALLSEHYGIPAISTGDIFRYNLKNQTELGKQAQAYMDRGELVPDELTNQIVKDRLAMEDAQNGWILDGYPRNAAQVQALDEMLADLGTPLDHAVVLEAAREVLLERSKMDARRVVGGMKKARAEVFTAYHSFVRKVNALVTLNGPEDYSAFVDAMNKMIERYEEEIIKKPKKRKKAEK